MSKGGMTVSIDSWLSVASWSWDIRDSYCTVCMYSFETPCPHCKFPGDDCPPIEGSCGHHFHLHCIYKWLESKDECPLCRVKWTEKVSSGAAAP